MDGGWRQPEQRLGVARVRVRTPLGRGARPAGALSVAAAVVIVGALVASVLGVRGAGADIVAPPTESPDPSLSPAPAIVAPPESAAPTPDLASPTPSPAAPTPAQPTPTPATPTPATPTPATSAPGLAAPVPTPTPTATPTPSPPPTPTATPAPAIVPPRRAPTVDGPVPPSLLSSLRRVSSEMPLPYRDGCHGAAPMASRCFYGNVRSRTTIVLFGDSHALTWFPAVLRVAQDRGWRVINVTRSMCPPARVFSYSRATRSILRSCLTWRSRAILRMEQMRPAIVLLSGSRGFVSATSTGQVLTGRARTNDWIRGMKWTLDRLEPAVGRAILLADTPNSRFASPAACLASNPRHSMRCATSVTKAISYPWLNVEYGVAEATKAGFINPERWVCPTSPCPAVVWGRLVHRNRGHLTVSFPLTQWSRLKRAILAEVARSE
jgi:SGNH domain-containing protein